MQATSALHEEARRLAGNGVPVFPCVAGTKRPATLNGFHDASTDLDIIDAWWSEDPNYNIAFSPHMVGLGVIDLDGEEGELSWDAWQNEHARLAETYTVRTPRGGRHLYYRGILPATQSKLGVHVDTRGIGSYALVPPSVVEGSSYTVLDGRAAVDLDPSVNEFLEALKRDHAKAAIADLDTPQNVARATRLLTDYVARDNVAVEGHMGNAKTFVTACEVLNLGLTVDCAADLIADLWNPHCVPPWEDDELRVIVDNASRYAQNEPGAWAVESSEETFGQALDKLTLLDPPPPEPPKRKRFKLWSLAELRKRPPPSWLIQELLPDKGPSMLYGPPGSYKSYLATMWSCELASVGIPVAYVAGEGVEGVSQRSYAWQLANNCSDDMPLKIMDEAPWANDPQMVVEFIEELAIFKPALVVIDTLARAAVGLNENDARDMGLFVAFLDAMRARLGCAILVIHHTGKDGARGARGSNALEGAMEAAFEAKGDKATKSVAVYVRRQKNAAERETPFCFEAKPVGSELVFQSISHADYVALTRVQDRLAPKEIGHLLRALGAVGPDNAVSTHVLATELVNRAEPELSDEAQEALVARQCRVLGKLAKTRLEAYCSGLGATLVWFLP